MQCLHIVALGMKKRGSKKEKIKPVEKKQPPEQETEKDTAFNFGGLPDRNLKKNLGC